ncbi:restriction endonuclease [Polaromonas sp.]|uniref:restriction endonuclease n=1 Tax=Polaromonas sp. TaxID=1869339 RepID=UPI003264072A
MVTRTPDNTTPRSTRYLFVLGLVAMGLGFLLLLLPVTDAAMRPVGAVALLFGILLVGSYFLGRLKAEMSADNRAAEPTWRKPAHGSAGYGSLPVSDAPVAGARGALARPAVAAPAQVPQAALLPLPPAPPPAAPAIAVPASWTLALFDRMSAQQFDAVCEALFAQSGFETRCQSHGATGGVTIWLYSRHAQQGKDSPVAVALCKQWPGQPVGVRELHPLLELMASRQLKRGTCATSAICTDNARKFAKYNGINLLDRQAVLDLIARRSPVQQQALLALAQGS